MNKQRLLFTVATILASCSLLQAQDLFSVRLSQPAHAKISVTPQLPEDGKVPAGTVLDIKVEDIEEGWAFDSGYYLSMSGGMFYPTYKEVMTPQFQVTVNSDIMDLGASVVESWYMDGYKVIQDVEYAKPGVKSLKYDMYIPNGAKNLPCIVIIHGGGWSSNTEDIMRGLARELVKGGKYAVASIDYRWLRNGDGDTVPNTMNMLIEDCFGAILHIQEHAAKYGINPNRIAVTGDSAGGHLSASMATLIERIGSHGFGKTPGVYEYCPTYMPKGMTTAQAKAKLLASIKAAAPSYGVFDAENLKRFAEGLPEDAADAIAPDSNIPAVSARAIPQYFVLGTQDRTVKREPIEKYVADLQAKGQRAELVIIEGASHAFFDWKPDQNTKNTFAKFGVPYAADMMRFFDSVFYKGNSKKAFLYPFQNPTLSEEARLDNAVSLMTVDEKITTVVGGGVPRLGIANPGSTEAIHGIVRGGDAELPNIGNAGQFQGNGGGQNAQRRMVPRMRNSTAFPQAYGIGETWDREMAHIVGDVMSYEARYYSEMNNNNCLILWAPNADLARDPRWGRTEESFGEDAFLVGEMVASEVKGIQGSDPNHWRGAALMKHFLANSNEDNRYSTDSRFDEDLFRDYYSYGFWKGAKAGAKSLMTAYNRYNGVPCEANSFINEILRKEWGMTGSIVNDAGALPFMSAAHHYTKDVNESIKLSLEAGLSRFIDSNFAQVKAAYQGGYLSDAVLNAATKANLRTMLRLGLMDAKSPYNNMLFDQAPWETQEFKDKARLVSQKSVVLLKNQDNILPIDTKKVKKIAVFGNRAEEVLKDWYGALPAYRVSPLQGIMDAVKDSDVEVKFQRWDSDGSAQKLAEWADVCIVCVGNHPATSPDWGKQSIQAPWANGTVAGDGREALDRRSLQLETEDLIKVVWQANHNTVVSLISSFPFAINWTNEHVPGIVHMTQCSQELGNALADVLFGKYNPAGRTTQTWVKDILDLPNMLDYNIKNGRTYMYFQGEPLYPFGYGLSYTQFSYSDLKVERSGKNFVFSFDLKNSGAMDGEEVVQLYAKLSGDDAAKRLRGFERIALKAGETKQVQIVVPEDDLKLWDMTSHSFQLNKGQAQFMIGASSADIRLQQIFDIR